MIPIGANLQQPGTENVIIERQIRELITTVPPSELYQFAELLKNNNSYSGEIIRIASLMCRPDVVEFIKAHEAFLAALPLGEMPPNKCNLM